MLLRLLIVWLSIGHTTHSWGTVTGGIPGATVAPNQSAFQYRMGYAPARLNENASSRHWLHYQQSSEKNSSWRVIADIDEQNGTPELIGIRTQYLWVTTPQETAYRIDLRARKGHRPEQLSLAWINQLSLNEDWSVRGVIIGSWQAGAKAQPGTLVEFRHSLSYTFSDTQQLAFEGFSHIGRISKNRHFNDQSHLLGFKYTHKVAQWNFHLGYLKGLGGAAPEQVLRLWFGFQFE